MTTARPGRAVDRPTGASYLSVEPDWQPTLPAAGPSFGLADLLTLGLCRDRPDGS